MRQSSAKPTAHYKSCLESQPGYFRQTLEEFKPCLIEVALRIDEDRVVEDFRLTFMSLMERAHYRRALGGHARTFFVHSPEFSELVGVEFDEFSR